MRNKKDKIKFLDIDTSEFNKEQIDEFLYQGFLKDKNIQRFKLLKNFTLVIGCVALGISVNNALPKLVKLPLFIVGHLAVVGSAMLTFPLMKQMHETKEKIQSIVPELVKYKSGEIFGSDAVDEKYISDKPFENKELVNFLMNAEFEN